MQPEERKKKDVSEDEKTDQGVEESADERNEDNSLVTEGKQAVEDKDTTKRSKILPAAKGKKQKKVKHKKVDKEKEKQKDKLPADKKKKKKNVIKGKGGGKGGKIAGKKAEGAKKPKKKKGVKGKPPAKKKPVKKKSLAVKVKKHGKGKKKRGKHKAVAKEPKPLGKVPRKMAKERIKGLPGEKDLETMTTSIAGDSASEEVSVSTKDTGSESISITRESIIHPPELIIMTETQFRNLNSFYEDLLNSLVSPEENFSILKKQFSQLLRKFRICFAVQTSLKNKLREFVAEAALRRKDHDDLFETLNEKVQLADRMEQDLEIARGYASQAIGEKHEFQMKIESLKEEILKLMQEIKELREAPLSTQPAMRMREAMIMERNALNEEIAKLQNDLLVKEYERADEHNELKKTKHNLDTCQDNFIKMRNELHEEVKKRSKADKAVLDTRKALKENDERLKSLNSELNTTRSSLEAMTAKANRSEDDNRKLKKEYELLNATYENLRRDFDINEAKLFNVQSQRDDLTRKLQNQVEETQGLKSEMVTLSKQSDRRAKQLLSLETYKKRAEEKIDELKADKQNLRNQMVEMRSLHLKNEKEVEEFKREKLELQEKISRYEHLISKFKFNNRVKDEVAHNQKRQLEMVHSKLDNYTRKFKEMQMAENSLLRRINDVTVKNDEQTKRIRDYQSSTADYEEKLSDLNEQLKTESNCHQLTKSKLTEFQNKFYTADGRCVEFCDEIVRLNDIIEEFTENEGNKNSESCYKRLELNLRKLMAERFRLKAEIEKQTAVAREARSTTQANNYELRRLLKEVERKTAECQRLDLQVNKLREKYNTVRSLLRRKDDEIRLLKEKLFLQNRAFSRGVLEYKERVKDIKLLKREVFQIARAKGISQKQASKLPNLRHEIARVEKELVQEKLRAKALEAAMQNPMNIHRWRLLEGSDPERHQLLTKNQYLQKRLMNAMIECDRRNMELKQSNQRIDELKELLKKQPSLQTVEEAKEYKLRCRKLRDKCRILTAQVNMYESFCSSYKGENDGLIEQLNKCKQEIYQQNLKIREEKEKS